MPPNNVMSEKKKALIAYKEKMLQEIKYYDRRIEDMHSKGLKNSFFESTDSSDSEEEFSLSIECGPSVAELKHQQVSLKTCLQATQELTSLQVLQSEVNVLVDDPVYEGERPITEPGVWREVTAECRLDLVLFTITFFVHQPDRKFGSPSYRGLRVALIKSSHEGELNKSVLPTVSTPSEAVEVLRSYACAQRSRRSTLARLADKFANTLYMEPMPDGGYILKCANLLEVSWTLQNKWSPIAPFHHRMKFDLEYMDESYIKTITQVHRQLSDPSIDTDERTLLLAKIISTCLEAQGPTQELYESMSSDPDVAQTLKRRRTTLDQEPEAPGVRRMNSGEPTDSEVMAPPKSLPKKAKPKGKENIAENRKLKRGNSDDDLNKNKKIKTNAITDHNLQNNNIYEANKEVETAEKSKANENQTKNANPKAKTDVSNKNSAVKKVASKNIEDDNVNEANKEVETADKSKANKNQTKNANNKTDVSNKNSAAKKVASKNNADDKVESSKNNVEKQVSAKGEEKNTIVREKSDLVKSNDDPKTVNSNKNVNKVKTNKNDNANDKNVPNTQDSEQNINKPKMMKEKSNDKIDNVNKKDSDKNAKKPKLVKEKSNDKITGVANAKKDLAKNAEVPKEKSDAKKVVKTKNIPDSKVKDFNDEVKDNVDLNKKSEKISKNVNSAKSKSNTESTENTHKNVKEIVTKTKVTKTLTKVVNKPKDVTDTTKKNTGNTQVQNTAKNVATTKTKQTDKDSDSSNKPKNIPGNIEKAKKVVANVKPSNLKESTQNKQENRINKPKSVANAKTKNSNKDDKTKKSTTNIDKNKESTIEKVVEKRQSVNRKSNLLDINNIDSGKKKSSNNLDIVEKLSSTDVNNKNVAVKRKSNYVDKADNVASSKKRALNPENATSNPKKAIKEKKNEANFQKATKSKIESKFKTKLMPGSFKTHIAGNTNKVLSAGNILSDKTSKIPQKLTSMSEVTLKKNPLRISPRKIPSKFKTTVDGAKFIQKTTNIPRLLKKPTAKT